MLETIPSTRDTNITKTRDLSSKGLQSSRRRQIHKTSKYKEVLFDIGMEVGTGYSGGTEVKKVNFT